MTELLWPVAASLLAVVAFRYVEKLAGIRLGPRLGREGELLGQVEALRRQVADLKSQLDEALRREMAAHRQLQDVKALLATVQRELEALAASGEGRPKVARARLLVALGDAPQFALDLAALRAVRTRTGLEYTRIRSVTRETFAGHLDRARANGRPFGLVHLGVHGSAEGLLFGDGLVSWDWLSGVLNGVEILVIAACDSSSVGDWLGVVPHVITMSEQLGMEDGARFAQLFWTEIGFGAAAQEALQAALDRSASHLVEHVVAHW